MDKLARRKHFERLVELRDAYAARGPEDSTSIVSVEVMLRRAAVLLDRPLPPVPAIDEAEQKH
jgi:hypothetical protein